MTSRKSCDKLCSPMKKGLFFCAHFYGVMTCKPLPSQQDIGRQWADPHRGVFSRSFCAYAAGPVKGRVQLFCCSGQTMKEVPNMAKAGNRVKITLRCSECKQRNYNTNKNKKNTPDRLELNKYCPFCRKHTVHNETK